MKYLLLFSLHIQHAYYSDAVCPDFVLTPMDDTKKLLRNHRCVTKYFTNGVHIYLESTEQNEPLISLDNGTPFNFQVQLTNPDFPLFTDLTDFDLGSPPVFGNFEEKNEQPYELTILPDPSSTAAKAFAFVKIQYQESWISPDNAPPIFTLSFQAKESRWHYYLLTDVPEGIFTIKDENAPPIQFADTKHDANNQPSNLTPFAQNLTEKNPALTLWIFESTHKITDQQSPRKTLQLQLDGNQVIAPLNSPSYKNFDLIDAPPNGSNQKENLMYQVIKYFAHQIPSTGG